MKTYSNNAISEKTTEGRTVLKRWNFVNRRSSAVLTKIH